MASCGWKQKSVQVARNKARAVVWCQVTESLEYKYTLCCRGRNGVLVSGPDGEIEHTFVDGVEFCCKQPIVK